jgi:hypothetical protein
MPFNGLAFSAISTTVMGNLKTVPIGTFNGLAFSAISTTRLRASVTSV